MGEKTGGVLEMLDSYVRILGILRTLPQDNNQPRQPMYRTNRTISSMQSK